jgi:hypothetical protein
MNRIIKILFIIFLLEFIFTGKVLAVTLDVSNIPATISASPFSVTVSILGANVGKNYLRVDLFKDGTINYFGETYNGSEWYTGSTGTSYFPIDIVSSSATASADVPAQIGAPSSTDYLGSGQYKLRIRRYTSASSYSAGNPYDIYIDLPTPTPTPSPSPTPSPTPTPTPTPTKTPTPIASPKITPKAGTPTPTPTENPEVLGIETMSPIPAPSSPPNIESKPPILAFVLIGLGALFIGSSVYLGIKSIKNSRRENDI